MYQKPARANNEVDAEGRKALSGAALRVGKTGGAQERIPHDASPHPGFASTILPGLGGKRGAAGWTFGWGTKQF